MRNTTSQVDLEIAELFITYNGKDMTLEEWAVEYDIDLNGLRHRYEKGLRGEELFLKPPLTPTARTKRMEEK